MKVLILAFIVLISGCECLSNALMSVDPDSFKSNYAPPTYQRSIHIDAIDLGQGMTQYTVH